MDHWTVLWAVFLSLREETVGGDGREGARWTDPTCFSTEIPHRYTTSASWVRMGKDGNVSQWPGLGRARLKAVVADVDPPRFPIKLILALSDWASAILWTPLLPHHFHVPIPEVPRFPDWSVAECIHGHALDSP